MYNVMYVNIIKQFDHIYCTVITSDDTGTNPDVRVDKQYSNSPSQQFLLNDAINDVYVYNNEIIDNTEISINFDGIL